MSRQLKGGDEVEWQTPQGKTAGIVRKKLTAKTKIRSHVIAASKDDPQYLVESNKSARVAAHKQSALKRRGS